MGENQKFAYINQYVTIRQQKENLEAKKKNVPSLNTTCQQELEKYYYFSYFFSDSETNLKEVLKNLMQKKKY